MHGLPSRSGAELIGRAAPRRRPRAIPVLTEPRRRISMPNPTDRARRRGRAAGRRAGSAIGCRALVLACSGYGGNRRTGAPAHPGNGGRALFRPSRQSRRRAVLGRAAGRARPFPDELSGPRLGRPSPWHPHHLGGDDGGRLPGRRERAGASPTKSQGYSEQAARARAKPGGTAFHIFDERIAGIARQFDDFREAEAVGAVVSADSVEALAARLKLPAAALAETFAEVERLKGGEGADRFGRAFAGAPPLSAALSRACASPARCSIRRAASKSTPKRACSARTAARCRTSTPPEAPPRACRERRRPVISRATDCSPRRFWAASPARGRRATSPRGLPEGACAAVAGLAKAGDKQQKSGCPGYDGSREAPPCNSPSARKRY